ncbi:MAG TPA: DUF3108 domain-containing protein [Longimicrobium sp.]|nr:DUF3108 domain-containing protein [Longimicrobium sp.]
MVRRGGAVLAIGAAALAAGTAAAEAPQQRVPFRAGESATYQVKLAGVPIGSGSLAVTGMQTVRGQRVFHTVMTLAGGNALYRVNDRFESWIDADGVYSLRFHQNQREGRFRRNRTYDFFPETRTFRRENGDTGTIPTSEPLDDLSFIYFARTLPLEAGARYSLPRYFKADGNPVVLQVLRRETVSVPAGRFRTIVVRPIIQTDGMFGRGGQAEVFFSDDEHRIPVLIRTRGIPRVGALTMHLRTFRPGR